jgi:hypothetical protein
MNHKVLSAYHRQLINLDYTRGRMESLYAQHRVSLRDVSAVYESLFLRAVVGFEEFCEELFFEILDGKTRYATSKVIIKFTAVSSAASREIVLHRQKYLTWLPFSSTEERVGLYFVRRGPDETAGRPFMEVQSLDKKTLEKIVLIRNVIAHRSAHAIRMFEQSVLADTALLAGEKTPAGFLRSQSTPSKKRFEDYIETLASIAKQILGKPL